MTPAALGDSAYVTVLDGPVDDAMADRVDALRRALAEEAWPGLTDLVPAFASVAMYFAPGRVPEPDEVQARLDAAVRRMRVTSADAARVVELSVAYGGEAGPDLDDVARHTGLSREAVIARHAGAVYRVHAIGFVPGFPYLGGLPRELATPRRSRPRSRVPAGSVGIGGAQTGVYPVASPGGWNLIGHTAAPLFDAGREPPALLRTGDRVRFVPVPAVESARVAGAPPSYTVPAAGGEVGAAGGRETKSAAAGNRCTVLRAGGWTTVQDGGRRGFRAEGVPLSGACDPFALRVANLLVGNREDAPALEVTLVGPELRFARDTVVALGGAESDGLPAWRPQVVRAGETLRVGPLTRGCRGVLAIGGGIAVDPVLGSASTYVRAGLGGVRGREVRAGDDLALGDGGAASRGRWTIDPRMLPRYGAATTVRVVAGAQAREFGDAVGGAEFRVSAQSDRMGLRLEGAAWRRVAGGELVSSPVVPGTVQVPPDGQPIVLLADAQTIGGYPQWGHVIAVDLPVVAQLRPGDRVAFRTVTPGEARELARAQERAIGLLREGLARLQR